MARHGELSTLTIQAAAAPGDNPRHGRLTKITLEAVDSPGNVDARHGELTYMRLLAVTLAVEDLLPIKVKSWTNVTTTAVLTDGTQADEWHWAQDSGPTVDLQVNGNQAVFQAPALVDTDDVVISVYATKQGGDSPPVTRTITIRPHQWWKREGGTFVPKVRSRI